MVDLSNKSVMILGDSIMNGSGNHDFGVGEYLVQDFGMTLFKYCVGGARVGYKEGKNWVIEQVRLAIHSGNKPDYILFNGFTNDCYRADSTCQPDVPLGEISQGYDPENIFEIGTQNTTFSGCFESIVYALMTHFPQAKILFIRPHNMGRREDALQRLYGERALSICQKWGIPYVDLYRESGMNTFLPEHRDLFTADTYGWGKGDCTHPNALGYQLKYMPLIKAKLLQL